MCLSIENSNASQTAKEAVVEKRAPVHNSTEKREVKGVTEGAFSLLGGITVAKIVVVG